MSDRPLMLYDGNCAFCTYWARRWAEKLAPGLRIMPLQQVEGRPSGLRQEDLEFELHLVEGEQIYRGAGAVFRALRLKKRYLPLWWAYRFLPGLRPLSEAVYRWVAANRGLVSRWTRWMRRRRLEA